MSEQVMCIAPEPIFWSLIDESRVTDPNGYDEFIALMCKTFGLDSADPDFRSKCYRANYEMLRDKGLLCEHPDHQPDEFRLH